MNSCSKTLPLFAVDNMAYDLKVFYTNTPPAGAYQGLSLIHILAATPGSFSASLVSMDLM